ncbi:hypothetical protein Pcinc_023430 [Petrolisthes cinctipes]|uniref:PiggyBac transposable element-derived protein domain-containing protein n=1 Tax=Petrolisthes cinctipes TaxID=88211 RepID=A0AAE1FDP4_PETCI|nr:hypothetical protein Pcinc_023430 [Petrolisthes cinctipes]
MASKKMSDREIQELMNQSGLSNFIGDYEDDDEERLDDVESGLESDDNLEAEVLYDSDDDVEYVPDPADETDVEEDEINIGKKRKQKFVSSIPKKQRPKSLKSCEPGPSQAQPAPPARPQSCEDEPTPGPSHAQPALPAKQRQHDPIAESSPVISFKEANIKTKSGFTWYSRPQKNIVQNCKPGPAGEAKFAATPYDCFSLFVTEDSGLDQQKYRAESCQIQGEEKYNCTCCARTSYTTVGTIKAIKKEIPRCMTQKTDRKSGTSAFLYTRDETLLSYMPEKTTKKKIVLLLSTMHNKGHIDESGKPEILSFYNSTKGGVDTFDQMCTRYSTSRKTKRWPLCLFYGMLNIATLNSYIIFNENMTIMKKKNMVRRIYMQELAVVLIRPWTVQRMRNPAFPRSLKALISSVFKLPPTGDGGGCPVAAETTTGATRCEICKGRADRKTRYRCYCYRRAVCPKHYYPICGTCVTAPDAE